MNLKEKSFEVKTDTQFMNNIINIVVAGIRWNAKWLLIKRKRGDYQEKWALVGGKIEVNEDLKSAILREIREETGLSVKWEGIKGVINERLIESDKGGKISHFIIILCQVSTKKGEIAATEEGELSWFSLDEIHKRKDEIIPSDYFMVTKLLQNEKIKQIIEVKMVQSSKGLELIECFEY